MMTGVITLGGRVQETLSAGHDLPKFSQIPMIDLCRKVPRVGQRPVPMRQQQKFKKCCVRNS
jgi:hypothetical protein